MTGNPGLPVYLLDGPAPILFDAGVAALADHYVRDIKAVLGDRAPAHLFLTHSHYDHISSAGRFKSVWPKLRVAASAKTRDVISRPNAISLIKSLNLAAGQALAQWGVAITKQNSFEEFTVDQILAPGDKIEISPQHNIEVIHSPGHTWDFYSYLIPEEKILVASEAVGCQDGGGAIVTEFLVDYDAYRNSLEGLTKLDVEVLCTGHHLVLTGEDVSDYMHRSLLDAAAYVKMVEEFLTSENGNLERVVEKVKQTEWDPKPLPKQPEPAYRLNTEARVKAVWKRMQK